MSFRARLTTFFILIVVVPMAAMGFLVFRLISDSEQGKADARANGIASAAAGVYDQASQTASVDARTVARRLEHTPLSQIPARTAAVASAAGIARIQVSVGGRPVADVGTRDAVAPGAAVLHAPAGQPARAVTISELGAGQFAGQFSGRGFGIIVRQGARILSSTVPVRGAHPLPRSGQITLRGRTYQTATLRFSGFGPAPVKVTVVSDTRATAGSINTDRAVAAIFILGFLILAFGFSLLASHALQSQLSGFLAAARRLGRGDFSSSVPTYGNDDFAALGTEFNNMSQQLAARLEELEREQARVRRSIRTIGDAFAANLDRDALLELALRTAMDATGADRGRVIASTRPGAELTERVRRGRL
ncbi:MAG: HAMP domain-containing protein, partial [Solirubrobacteraceae bacterium]